MFRATPKVVQGPVSSIIIEAAHTKKNKYFNAVAAFLLPNRALRLNEARSIGHSRLAAE
jgi:hypothetical protein